jgi:hypothetical protein
MTADGFRKLALSMPDALEAGHLDHPDFRIGGKIFATLGYPNDDFAMVKLTPEEQAVVIGSDPVVFSAANGAWGKNGATLVRLRSARAPSVRRALELAYDATAKKAARPKRR